MLEIRTHFRRIARLLEAEAEVAGGTGHAATTGSIRESVVQKFLQPHLPGTLDIRSGVIVDSTGTRSRQQDCVITDRRLPQLDVRSESHSLLIAESVLAAIEVKSHLDGSVLREVLEAGALTKRLVRRGEQEYHKGGAVIRVPEPLPIFTYVFAYDGVAVKTLGIAAADFAFEKNDPHCLPGGICVLRKGVVLAPHFMPTVEGQTVRLPALRDLKLDIRPYQQDSLLVFYRRLMDDIMPLRLINYDIDAYYAEEELE